MAREPIPEPIPESPARPMPEVRVEQIAGGEAIPPETLRRPAEVPADQLSALEQGEDITLTAQDTDLRALLAALAEAAGVNLVVSPEVEGRVTVHLENVPARQALETVIRESGNMIAEPLRPPWGPVVFYVAPADFESMTAEEIQAHFGVSAELARFIVRARVPR